MAVAEKLYINANKENIFFNLLKFVYLINIKQVNIILFFTISIAYNVINL